MATPQEAAVLVKDLFVDLKPNCGEHMPVHVDWLVEMIAKRCKLEIDLRTGKWPGKFIKGRLLRYGNRAEIHVSSELNTCWTRFVAAKELAHLLLDPIDGAGFTQDPAALVDWLVNDQWANAAEMHSERLAVLAAIEMLIPHHCHHMLESMVRGGSNSLAIATHFMVPEKMVDRRLNTKYRQWVGDAYAGLDQ